MVRSIISAPGQAQEASTWPGLGRLLVSILDLVSAISLCGRNTPEQITTPALPAASSLVCSVFHQCLEVGWRNESAHYSSLVLGCCCTTHRSGPKSGLLIGPDGSVLASHWLFLDPPFWKVVFLQVQNKTDENLVSFTEKLFVLKLSPGSSATLKLKYLTIIFATFWQSFATNSHADPILEIVQMFTKTVH